MDQLIITRSPLRITLGGGGTDLPSYYSRYGGYLISAAIDKYIYVSTMRAFRPGIFLKYSNLESAETVDMIKHPIFRETLKMYTNGQPQIEITTLADIPAGTGLGSSSSFTTALIAALSAQRKERLTHKEIAELACKVEIDLLNDPIGKQDQYISAYGGVTQLWFDEDGTVRVEPLNISKETQYELEDNLLLFFTGYMRSATESLKIQDEATKRDDAAMIGALHYTKELGFRSKEALEYGDLKTFADILHEHWLHKRKRSVGITSKKIDDLYELGRRNGARGGKLVGAGGGGFLMFYAENRLQLRGAMKAAGLEEVRFRFDFEGTKQVMS